MCCCTEQRMKETNIRGNGRIISQTSKYVAYISIESTRLISYMHQEMLTPFSYDFLWFFLFHIGVCVCASSIMTAQCRFSLFLRANPLLAAQ